LDLAHSVIRRTLHASRVVVARWAHLLITSKQSARALDEIAAVLSDLDALRILINPNDKTAVMSTNAKREEFVRRWRKAFVNAAVIYEDFEFSARLPGFIRWSPELTQDSDREVMAAAGIEVDKRSPVSGRIYSDLPPISLTVPPSVYQQDNDGGSTTTAP